MLVQVWRQTRPKPTQLNFFSNFAIRLVFLLALGSCRQGADRLLTETNTTFANPVLWFEVLTWITSSALIQTSLSLQQWYRSHTHTHTLAIAALLTSCQQSSRCLSLQWHKLLVRALWMSKEERAAVGSLRFDFPGLILLSLFRM